MVVLKDTKSQSRSSVRDRVVVPVVLRRMVLDLVLLLFAIVVVYNIATVFIS